MSFIYPIESDRGRAFKHLETIKPLRLRRRAFIYFSGFGTPDKKLALVFDLLHQTTPARSQSETWSHDFRTVIFKDLF